MIYALARPVRLDLDAFARACRLHPEMVRRYVALGILDAASDSRGRLWFAPEQVRDVARLQRLRAGFSLNYSALGLVVDLLDRIAALEAARNRSARTGARTWT
jgi:chaperone modulatory protein CbpM